MSEHVYEDGDLIEVPYFSGDPVFIIIEERCDRWWAMCICPNESELTYGSKLELEKQFCVPFKGGFILTGE